MESSRPSVPGRPCTGALDGTPFSVNLLPGWLTSDSFPLEQGTAA